MKGLLQCLKTFRFGEEFAWVVEVKGQAMTDVGHPWRGRKGVWGKQEVNLAAQRYELSGEFQRGFDSRCILVERDQHMLSEHLLFVEAAQDIEVEPEQSDDVDGCGCGSVRWRKLQGSSYGDGVDGPFDDDGPGRVIGADQPRRARDIFGGEQSQVLDVTALPIDRHSASDEVVRLRLDRNREDETIPKDCGLVRFEEPGVDQHFGGEAALQSWEVVAWCASPPEVEGGSDGFVQSACMHKLPHSVATRQAHERCMEDLRHGVEHRVEFWMRSGGMRHGGGRLRMRLSDAERM